MMQRDMPVATAYDSSYVYILGQQVSTGMKVGDSHYLQLTGVAQSMWTARCSASTGVVDWVTLVQPSNALINPGTLTISSDGSPIIVAATSTGSSVTFGSTTITRAGTQDGIVAKANVATGAWTDVTQYTGASLSAIVRTADWIVAHESYAVPSRAPVGLAAIARSGCSC
jgi:hypothetical protein